MHTRDRRAFDGDTVVVSIPSEPNAMIFLETEQVMHEPDTHSENSYGQPIY